MVKALVLYHSQEFGNTAAMAQAVAEGLRDAGCEVDLFNTNDGRFDVPRFPQCVGNQQKWDSFEPNTSGR